jgi:hypothetical protein
MEEECEEESYDTDSAISGLSPGERYNAKSIESDTDNGVGLSSND